MKVIVNYYCLFQFSKLTIKRLVSKEKYFLAKELYQEASICWSRSFVILNNPSDKHGVIEALQHCFELCVKSLWLVVGLEYPNTHDAGKNIKKVSKRLKLILPKLNYKIWDEYLENWIILQSDYMNKLHHLTIYGDEERGISASKLFSDEEKSEIIRNVSALFTFVGGPLQWIGAGLGLLTESEKKAYNEFKEVIRVISQDPNKISELYENVRKFYTKHGDY